MLSGKVISPKGTVDVILKHLLCSRRKIVPGGRQLRGMIAGRNRLPAKEVTGRRNEELLGVEGVHEV